MKGETSRKTALFALLPVVAIAFGLRIWGIDYGIPHPTARPDEERIVGRAQTIFATNEWHPGSFYYPSFLFYADTFALHAYYGAKKILGHYERPFDLLFEIAVTRPGLHYRIARFVSLLAGVATVLAAYALGTSAYERRSVGLIAALGVAVCHVHVRDSRFATVDVPSALFATLALVFAVRVTSRAPARNAVVAGLFAGLAASTKYNVGLVALALVVAAWRARASASASLGSRVGILAGAALAAIAAFAATSPFVVRRFGAFWNDMGFLEGFLYGSSTSPLALWGHLSTTFPAGLGWPLFAAAVLGVARAVHRRSDADLVLLAFLLPFFALIATVRLTFPRYVLPIVPVLIVLAAEAGVWLVGRVSESKRSLALAVLVAALVAPPLWSSVAFDRLAAQRDTRLEASDYIAANVPPQTLILLCRGYGAPHINEDRRRPPAHRVAEMDCFSETAVTGEGRFLVTHEHRELSSFSRVHPELSRWLEANATEVAAFDPYRDASAAKPRFYGADAFYIPFAGFSAVSRGGPLVRIWELPQR